MNSNALKIIDFNCWWFRGEEALALEFFRKLYSAMDSANGKEAFTALWAQILTGSSAFLGAVVNLVNPAAGTATKSGMKLIGNLIKQDKTVENYHKDIADTLKKQSKKFLIVIDDIDRLSPDEALLIFRLVKSIGQLPNVVYLLSYDRDLAERVVSERYPSEGPHYLEKIVQASFDLPAIPHANLKKQFMELLYDLWRDQSVTGSPHFDELFDEFVVPLLKSPRDVHRIINTLKTTWKTVQGEVHPVDFLCIETLRVQLPKIYMAIRAHKHLLVNNGVSIDHQNKEAMAQDYEDVFLVGLKGEARKQMKVALCCLFPALESIWGKTAYHDSGFMELWARDRLVRSKQHFNTYFRFSIAGENISMAKVNEIISNYENAQFVRDALLAACKQQCKLGRTMVAPLLGELALRAPEIPLEKLPSFLGTVFSAYDDICKFEDKEEKGLRWRSTTWCFNRLIIKAIDYRTTLTERSSIMLQAAQHAPLPWLIYLAYSTYENYNLPEGKKPKREYECLIAVTDFPALKKMTLAGIKKATEDHSLMDYRCLAQVLWTWDLLKDEDGSEDVKEWCNAQLSHDKNVVKLAKVFTNQVTSLRVNHNETKVTEYNPTGDIPFDSLKTYFCMTLLRKRIEETIIEKNFPKKKSHFLSGSSLCGMMMLPNISSQAKHEASKAPFSFNLLAQQAVRIRCVMMCRSACTMVVSLLCKQPMPGFSVIWRHMSRIGQTSPELAVEWNSPRKELRTAIHCYWLYQFTHSSHKSDTSLEHQRIRRIFLGRRTGTFLIPLPVDAQGLTAAFGRTTIICWA